MFRQAALPSWAKRARGYLRAAQIIAVVTIAFTMLGAGNSETAFERIGHKIMCPCGCAEILLECNHVGCPDSERMIGELHQQMDAALPEAAVLNWFALKYGPTVLAAPLRGGFDIVAWVVPFAVLALGIVAVVLLLRLWQARQRRVALPVASGMDEAMRERIRKDTYYGE